MVRCRRAWRAVALPPLLTCFSVLHIPVRRLGSIPVLPIRSSAARRPSKAATRHDSAFASNRRQAISSPYLPGFDIGDLRAAIGDETFNMVRPALQRVALLIRVSGAIVD